MSTKRTKAEMPTPRKVLALLTDDEWRALRVRAAAEDTTIQAFVTQVLLRELNSKPKQDPQVLREAR
jgi:hypothetical protein